MTQPATPERQPAYDAVYAVIRQFPPRSADDYGQAAENGRVWRAVTAALDAMEPVIRQRTVDELATALEGVYVGNLDDPVYGVYRCGKQAGYGEAAGTVRHHYDEEPA